MSSDIGHSRMEVRSIYLSGDKYSSQVCETTKWHVYDKSIIFQNDGDKH